MLIPARTGAAAVARNDLTSWALRIPAETWLLAGVTIVAIGGRLVADSFTKVATDGTPAAFSAKSM